MNKLSKIASAVAGSLALVGSNLALAAVDPAVTAANTAATTAFTDNFGPIATVFVTLSITVAMVLMAVKWFRRAAK